MDYERAKRVLEIERTIEVLRGIIEAEKAQFTRFDHAFYGVVREDAVREQAETIEVKTG